MVQIDPHISWGNIITWAGGLVSVFVIWARWASYVTRVVDRVEVVEKAQVKQQVALDEMIKLGVLTNQAQLDRRVTAVEACMMQIPKISTDLEWIKQKLNVDTHRT